MTSSEFTQLHDLLTGLVGEVRRVHERLDGLEAQAGRLESRMVGLETRQSKLGTAFEEMRADSRAFWEALQGTNRRLDALQAEMNGRFDEQHTLTAAGFRDWGERMTRIEERLAA